MTVQLQDYVTSQVLASADLSFAGGDWTQLNFSFVASRNTTCMDGSSDPNIHCGNMGPGAGHICIKCTGQFVVVSLNIMLYVRVVCCCLLPIAKRGKSWRGKRRGFLVYIYLKLSISSSSRNLTFLESTIAIPFFPPHS